MAVVRQFARQTAALFADGREIDAAIAKAVREAVLQHKRAGNPIAVWQDGRVVWIPPEEIVVDELDDKDS